MAQSTKLLNPFSERNKENFTSSPQKKIVLDPESLQIEVNQEDNKNYKKIIKKKFKKKEIIDQNTSYAYLKGFFSSKNLNSSSLIIHDEKNPCDISSKYNFNNIDNRDDIFIKNKEIFIEINENQKEKEIYSLSLNKIIIYKISEKYAYLIKPAAENFLEIIKALSSAQFGK